MAQFVFDIETGPRPLSEIESLYVPPEALPPWDDSMVKYGQTKDPAKRTEKYNEVKTAYMAKLAAEKQVIADHKAKWAADAALSPVTGMVLAIGVYNGDQHYIAGIDGETEADMLASFWAMVAKHVSTGRFIGFCSNFFDFPFLVWRSYANSVQVPAIAWDKTGRYPAYSFIDLIDRLPKRGFNDESRKLGDICQWLGIGGKPEGIDGGDFARLWAGDGESRQVAVSYLENDLDMTWALAERMGVVS